MAAACVESSSDATSTAESSVSTASRLYSGRLVTQVVELRELSKRRYNVLTKPWPHVVPKTTIQGFQRSCVRGDSAGVEAVLWLLIRNPPLSTVHVTGYRCADTFLNGGTVLHAAAHRGWVDVIQHLVIEPGVDIDLPLPGRGKTALHLAAARGHVQIVDLLVDAECNAEKRNDSYETALHAAAREGRSEVVSLLIDKAKCNVNATSLSGQTALHLAVLFEHWKTNSTVHILLAAGSNILITDKAGQCPLSIPVSRQDKEASSAMINSINKDSLIDKLLERNASRAHVEGEVPAEDALELLVEANGLLDLNEDVKRRVLEVALQADNVPMSTLCVKAGALSGASEQMKIDVLMLAANKGCPKLADICISAGALIEARQWPSPTPIDIARQRGHYRVASKIRKALDHHELLQGGSVAADSILIRLGGPPNAGKSTLANTLKHGRDRYSKQLSNGPSPSSQGVQPSDQLTKGIAVHTYTEGGTHFNILDMGGQNYFTASHQLFIGQGRVPVINIILVSCIFSKEKVQHELLKWAATYASCCELTFEGKRQPVMVVASHNTEADDGHRDIVNSAYVKAEKNFGGCLEFVEGPIFVDCRRYNDEGMCSMRTCLSALKERILKNAPNWPSISRHIQRALPAMRKKDERPVVTKEDFISLMSAQTVSGNAPVLQGLEGQLLAALAVLSDYCEVLIFEKTNLKDRVVIQPPWLLHDVIGAIMAPRRFKSPRIDYDHGRVSRQMMLSCLEEFTFEGTTAEDILDMTTQLGLSIIDGDQVLIPAKLDIKRDPECWAHNPLMEVYVGRRLRSPHGVPVSTTLFPQLQVRLYNYFSKNHNQVSQLWSGGILITPNSEKATEALVEMRRDQGSIDIIVRGWAGSKRECYALLQWLMDEVLELAWSLSPGSQLTEYVLSTLELKTKASKGCLDPPGYEYTKKDVKDAMSQGRLINDSSRSGPKEEPLSLLVVQADHVELMPADCLRRFCREMEKMDVDSEVLCDWRGLGGRLGVRAELIKDEEEKWERKALTYGMDLQSVYKARDDSERSPTQHILHLWSKESPSCSVTKLLDVVLEMGQLEAAAILETDCSEPHFDFSAPSSLSLSSSSRT